MKDCADKEIKQNTIFWQTSRKSGTQNFRPKLRKINNKVAGLQNQIQNPILFKNGVFCKEVMKMIEGILNIKFDMNQAQQRENARPVSEEVNGAGGLDETKKERDLVSHPVKQTSAPDESQNDNSEEVKKEMKNAIRLDVNGEPFFAVGSIINDMV